MLLMRLDHSNDVLSLADSKKARQKHVYLETLWNHQSPSHLLPEHTFLSCENIVRYALHIRRNVGVVNRAIVSSPPGDAVADSVNDISWNKLASLPTSGTHPRRSRPSLTGDWKMSRVQRPSSSTLSSTRLGAIFQTPMSTSVASGLGFRTPGS